MLQVRKLVLAVAAATSMASGMAHALGLGEVSVKSALNEPLVAEIELLDTKGLSAEDIRSKLASPEDFSRAGVDRQFFLNNLKFTPVVGSNGKSFVRVTSNQAVREPFLNFLLEVYWPAGRVLKEYTLLLDPPMYTPQELVYRGAPVTTPAAARTTPAAAPRVTTSIPARQPAAARSAAPALQGDQYRVQRNDTLWEIAQRANRGGSVHQVMLAIQDLNPDAFIDGNINRLKSGQVLKLPDAGQIAKRSRGQAVAEVQSQVDAWRTGAPVERQLDARRRETAAAAPARAEQGDNLRLVATETGETPTGSDSGVSNKAVNDQLALTKEQLDSALRQNQDLSSRVDELNSQVEKLQRLLDLKNTQLANLQNMTDEELAATLATADELDEHETVQQPAIDEHSQPDGQSLGVLEQETGAAVDELAGSQAADMPAVITEEPVVVEPVVAEPPVTAVEPAAAPVARPAPVAVQPAPEPKSFVDELLGNPLFLPAVGGGVGLLLLLLLIARRNKARQEQDALPPDEETAEGNYVQTGFAGSDMPDESAVLPDDLDTNIEAPAGFNDVPETSAAAPLDPVVEAENYISFGRFSQAAEVLHKAIDADPQREDLRFKLLEVYADLEDRNAFLRQVDELNAMGVAQDKLDALNLRFPHLMGEDDGLSLDDIMLDLPKPAQAPVAPAADDIPGLDDLLESSVADTAVDAAGQDEQDELSSLLDSVGAELDAEFGQGIDMEADLPSAQEPAELAGADDFQLSDLDALQLDDLELPALDDSASLTGSDELQLEDFELPEPAAAGQPAETVLEDFDQALDLSFPLEESTQQSADAGLDTGALEAGLESLEASFDELLDDMAALQGDTPEAAPAQAEEPALELDAGFDLATPERPAAAGDDMLAELSEELGDDFSFLQGDDEDKTKLDLASALTDMGDLEGAREILDEVIREGAPEHQEQARTLLAKLG